jgi:hypothetical protein
VKIKFSTTTDDASIPEGLIKELPGASTQPQRKKRQKDKIYVYDTKEDRNFAVGEAGQTLYWPSRLTTFFFPRE